MSRSGPSYSVGGAAGDRLRIGVLGAAGQVGRCLVREIEIAPDLDLAFAVTRAELDLGDTAQIDPFLDRIRDGSLARPHAGPDVVVNAAAFTKVDACETQVELAQHLNARVPGEWARALHARGIGFVHLSTDYVFPGDGTRPYREDDPTGPRSVYGASKLAGEQLVRERDPDALVVRTSWVFGPGRNFVLATLDQAAKRRTGEKAGPLQVVNDQRGSPTAATDLARGLLSLCRLRASARADLSGALHLCNEGVTTWFGFAREILDQAGYGEVAIDPVATGVFPTAAPRPAYSVLDCSRARALGISLRPWTEALTGYLAGPDRPTHLIATGGQPVPAASGSSSDLSSDLDRRKVSN
jgi:dTDP-4-dehydrorhamnose reductase